MSMLARDPNADIEDELGSSPIKTPDDESI